VRADAEGSSALRDGMVLAAGRLPQPQVWMASDQRGFERGDSVSRPAAAGRRRAVARRPL
jgi:hypothetical protein